MHVGDQSEQGASICRAVFVATVLSHLLLLRTCEVIAAVVNLSFFLFFSRDRVYLYSLSYPGN